MREFAKATVAQVEQFFELARAKWENPSDEYRDDVVVRFFLEDPETSGSYLYHAMVSLGDDAYSDPVLFGSPEEIPREWLDEASIRFYFKATMEDFCKDGFLDGFFGEDD